MAKLRGYVPYHTEELWALISTATGKSCMAYLLAPTRNELWESAVELEFFGTGITRQNLADRGFVARRVLVTEVPR